MIDPIKRRTLLSHLAAGFAASLTIPASLARAEAAKSQRGGKTLIGMVLYPGFEVLDVFGPVECGPMFRSLRSS